MTYKSKFGFGCMRLPLTDKNDPTSINQDLFNEMVDIYMEKGYDYFDTSYAYHNGMSEVAIRKAVVERYPRESFRICDKMPTWALTCEEDNEKFVNEMLERLGIEYFDVFFIHNINGPWVKNAINANTFEYVKKMKENGVAKQIGFSFHDKSDLLEEVLDKYGEMFDIVQLELNYLDWEDPSIEAHKCYDLCVKHGLDVYVMEPLKGGVIVNPNDEIKNDFKEFNPDKSIASFAIRFCASLENVKIVLSGMSKMEDLIDNCDTYENFEVLSDEENSFLEKMALKLADNVAVPCSECGYCVDACPEMIPIPEYFNLYNTSKNQPESDIYRLYFDKLADEKVPADECTYCSTCIDHCTQKIDIPEMLEKVCEHFEQGFTPYG
ncbi:aldo/keto reductase [Methanobrevibacter thaueri]|uniref:2,5-diketo-D-gluconate reductase A n=1 Tax=Methanobrevibacter thaueri TaxID=190975 RepID=A0A315XMT0_9EURY|nr:aldo/keto reductase [Methanobrevibacter thaueri]PWB87681.1 2,5-diketo-D-gluconate reductase A [Methanobrevibacter thaueri]